MTTPTLSRIKIQAVEQNAIGIQFVGDVFSDWQWNGATGYHELVHQLNPAFVNLMGAAQVEQATARAREVQLRHPQTSILWRHMRHQPPGESDNTDRNMWRLPATEYVQNVIVAHGYHQTDRYIVTDNEGSINSPTEAKQYAGSQAQVLDEGVPLGAKFAVLRTSTHNPPLAWLNAGYFDELFKGVARNMGSYLEPSVILSMNAYYDDDPNYGNDALKHIKAIEDRFIFVTGRRPVICLGELGYDKGFTSEAGWKTTAMSAEANATLLVNRFNTHLGPYGYAACAWCEGVSPDAKVKNFVLTPAGIRVLISLAPRWIRSEEPPTLPIPTEPPATTPPPSPNGDESPDDDDTEVVEPVDTLAGYVKTLRVLEIEMAEHHAMNRQLDALERWLIARREEQDKLAQALQIRMGVVTNKIEELQEEAAGAAIGD